MSLHTIDLSLFDSPNQPKVVEDLVQLTKSTIKEDCYWLSLLDQLRCITRTALLTIRSSPTLALQHLRIEHGTVALGSVNRSVCRLQAKAWLESRSKPVRRHLAIQFLPHRIRRSSKQSPSTHLPLRRRSHCILQLPLSLREPTSPYSPVKSRRAAERLACNRTTAP